MTDEKRAEPKNIDEYIAFFPEDIRKIMSAMRKAIREAAPMAEEKISWRMPTFVYFGNLVHFAGHTNHLGFYPGADGVEHFEKELAPYKTSKGAVQFPYHKPVPYDLVQKIVRYRVGENEALAAAKTKKK